MSFNFLYSRVALFPHSCRGSTEVPFPKPPDSESPALFPPCIHGSFEYNHGAPGQTFGGCFPHLNVGTLRHSCAEDYLLPREQTHPVPAPSSDGPPATPVGGRPGTGGGSARVARHGRQSRRNDSLDVGR